jgi:hypothetical protein
VVLLFGFHKYSPVYATSKLLSGLQDSLWMHFCLLFILVLVHATFQMLEFGVILLGIDVTDIEYSKLGKIAVSLLDNIYSSEWDKLTRAKQMLDKRLRIAEMESEKHAIYADKEKKRGVGSSFGTPAVDRTPVALKAHFPPSPRAPPPPPLARGESAYAPDEIEHGPVKISLMPILPMATITEREESTTPGTVLTSERKDSIVSLDGTYSGIPNMYQSIQTYLVYKTATKNQRKFHQQKIRRESSILSISTDFDALEMREDKLQDGNKSEKKGAAIRSALASMKCFFTETLPQYFIRFFMSLLKYLARKPLYLPAIFCGQSIKVLTNDRELMLTFSFMPRIMSLLKGIYKYIYL